MSNNPEATPHQPEENLKPEDSAAKSNISFDVTLSSSNTGQAQESPAPDAGNTQMPKNAPTKPVAFHIEPPVIRQTVAPNSSAVNSAEADNAETAVLAPPNEQSFVSPSNDGFIPPTVGTAFANASEKPRTGKKTTMLFAGIAIGAVIGGLVGGGTAAVMASDGAGATQQTVSDSTSITLNNTDSVSQVTAVAANTTPSIVTLQVTGPTGSGNGSGVIYTQDGYIITNSHVVTLSGATANPEIRVRLFDGTMMNATLVGTDPFADIAVVKVDAEDLPAIEIADSEKLNVGQTAIAIGAPLNLSNTVTSGIVSALNRGISVANSMVPEGTSQESQSEQNQQSPFPWDFQFEIPQQQQQQQEQQQSTQAQNASRVAISVLQTDASINPGNSGGALLNDQGELIGINVALAANGASTGTAGSDGLGFAIPSNLAVRVADSLIAGEQPSHGKLGISVVEAANDTDEDALLEGALISEIVAGSAAERSGLKVGDVITSIAGSPVNSSTTASALIRYHEGGSTVNITYSRNGVLNTIDAELDTLTW